MSSVTHSKKTGRIFMQDSFGQNAGYAMLGHSLHETVHLVSHPPGIAPKGKSSARNILAKGLKEARSNMGKPVFQIVNSTKFSQVMQSLDDHDESNDTTGVTDTFGTMYCCQGEGPHNTAITFSKSSCSTRSSAD
jgi:hypothetical protein